MRRAAAVAALAAASRLLLLGSMAAFDALLADYDTSAGMYRTPCSGPHDRQLAAPAGE